MKTKISPLPVEKTVDQIGTFIEKHGWHLFARIDHAKEAQEKGLDLRPTVLILFGNPEIGTLLMQDSQKAAIDLPMKVLVSENENGETEITFNDIENLKERHHLTDDETVHRIAEFVENATSIEGAETG
jgi:uncharacterized protein (DUF302 family)